MSLVVGHGDHADSSHLSHHGNQYAKRQWPKGWKWQQEQLRALHEPEFTDSEELINFTSEHQTKLDHETDCTSRNPVRGTNVPFPCGQCPEPFPTVKERDRHYQTIHANEVNRPHNCSLAGCQASVLSWTKVDKLRAHNKKWHGPHHCPEGGCIHSYPNGYGAEQDLHNHLKAVHGVTTPLTPVIDTPKEKTVGIASTSLAARSGSYIKAKEGPTSEESFDPNYRVHPEKEFKFGKVFKLLWTEPAGNSADSSGNSTVSTSSCESVHRGESLFVKIRRFVIISQRKGHCLCLPINTYSTQGTLKQGVRAEDHAIIYTDRPTPLEGEIEKGLKKNPIRFQPSRRRDKLDIASRLNYAKLYTIEYNLNVRFIGKISKDSEDTMIADYNAINPLISNGTLGSKSGKEDSKDLRKDGKSSAAPTSAYPAKNNVPFIPTICSEPTDDPPKSPQFWPRISPSDMRILQHEAKTYSYDEDNVTQARGYGTSGSQIG